MLKGFVSGEEKDIVRIPMKVGNEYKEGWEVRDSQDRLIWGREDELQTATSTLPFKGYSLPVKVKSLLGNGQQTGTPTPDNPVMPEFVGVRTGNLFDEGNALLGYEIINDYIQENSNWFVSDFIPVESGKKYIATNAGAPALGYETKQSGSIRLSGSIISGITIPENIHFIRVNGQLSKISSVMLNPGDTALPYEPYGWKVPFENHGENLFYSDRTKQNTTASSAIDQTEGSSELVISKNETSSAVALSVTINLPLRAGTYTVSIDGLSVIEGNLDRINLRDSDGVIVNNVMTGSPQTFTIAADTVVNAVVFVCDSTSTYTNKKVRIMLNSGSRAKPYSPYLNTTIPVYLGEVPTVRRVKKLVLKGTEEIGSYQSVFYIQLPSDAKYESNAPICTHFLGSKITPLDNYCIRQMVTGYWGGQLPALQLKDSSHDSILNLKDFFAAQYANGTPVTIWYVLATPETTISNEPLCKISTYADELTAIQVHGLSAPLYGIGDYKDTLNLSTGVVTRKVKKRVFDGSETWILSGNIIYINNTDTEPLSPLICTHFPNATNTGMWNGNGWVFQVDISRLGMTGRNAWIGYLQQQYQNGTPVTVWYVLSTPTTETITVPTGMTGEIEGYLTQVSTPSPSNRSVPKWNGVEETGGTYAVTVYTPPEIPTTTGQNTLTVETEKIHGLTNPLCGIGDYKDVLNLSTGVITRKVKKLVLDGTENWEFYSSSGGIEGVWQFYVNDVANGVVTSSAMSNIAAYGVTATTRANYLYGAYLVTSGTGIAFQMAGAKDVFTGVTSWKSFLAAQYQNGTPVTVWYVLSTPETETITVPYGLECSVEGYLTQSTTPTPSSPITPDSNGILESGGTYAVEVSLVPSNLTVKGHIKELT